MGEGWSFGRLPSPGHAISRQLKLLGESERSVGQCFICCSFIFILFWGCLFLTPLALGVTELVIFMEVMDEGEGCDMPLKEWILCVGIVHIISFLRSLWGMRQSEEQREHEEEHEEEHKKKSFFDLLWNAIDVGVFIVGAVFVYQATRDKCPTLLYDYCFYFVTVGLSITGFLFLGTCCVGCAICCYGAKEEESAQTTFHFSV